MADHHQSLNTVEAWVAAYEAVDDAQVLASLTSLDPLADEADAD